MYKPLKQYRAKEARAHKAWFALNAKNKPKVRFFPLGTDWSEVAEKMTAAERKFYGEHIEKSRRIKWLIRDILTMIERRKK